MSSSALEEHILLCGSGDFPEQVYKIPEANTYKFNSYEQTLRVPYTLYFVFHEYFTPSPSSLTKQEGTPVAYSIVLSTPNSYSHLEYYFGEDCIFHFLNRSLEIAHEVLELVASTNIPISATETELRNWQLATKCSMYRLPFSLANPKIKHYVHYTGQLG